MNPDVHQKVNAGHLKRNAYLYVRQSTLRQVLENTESTKRQYGLRQHAVALGWPVERIIVIDSDLGQSGASAVDREGFQKLVTEVGLGKAGIVLGLEVSRLARNSTDWHRLLEICALTDTLILDEDGVYDPAHFNDRLLLGLKGTMSEAELHVLRARLQGGILNKARRGELQCPLPVGFLYNASNQPALDPDQQVQESIRFFFDTFRRTASACAVVKAFRRKGLLFPRRLKKGPNKGDLVWANCPTAGRCTFCTIHVTRAHSSMAAAVLADHPNGGTSYTKLPREQWMLFQDTHPGYISWPNTRRTWCASGRTLKRSGQDRRKRPPREGPALLQGSVVCGDCGEPDDSPLPRPRRPARPRLRLPAQRARTCHLGMPAVSGIGLDKAIGELLLEASLRWRLRSPWQYSRNSTTESSKWTDCAGNRLSERAMRPTWLSVATFKSILTTVS